MQRVIRSACELAINDDQVLHARHFAREHDAIARQADLLGVRRAIERRRDERFAHHCIGALRRWLLRVPVHQTREQRRIEAAPVDPDANRLAVANRLLDHDRELRVAFAAFADIARIDPIFRERLRTIGMVS